jgi:hypothetical protein
LAIESRLRRPERENVCLDIADVVRDAPTILRKKIEELRILRVICLALRFENLRQSQGAALEGARGLDLGKG